MTKLSKILRILAAAAFLTAMAVNVKVTLTDPFVGMSEEAVAQTTSDTSSSQTLDPNACYCLVNYLYQEGHHPVSTGKCFREAYGPDIFEGYSTRCEAGGYGCQPKKCKHIIGQCYEVEL
jgi:hypothetical protein